ncbi:MAG: sugar phosphate nucleotidyltransferase [bacterium]
MEDAALKPKAMIGVGDRYRPFLDYLLYNACAAGYQDIVIVIGANDEVIRSYYGKKDRGNKFHGAAIAYAVQTIPPGKTKPLGTADALLQALQSRADWRGKSFTVCNSDNLYSQKALTALRESTLPGALIDYDRRYLRFEDSRVQSFAVIRKDEQGFLLDIVEKPSTDQLEKLKDKNGRVGVSMNIFRFSFDFIYPELEKTPLHPERLEKELPTAVKMMIARRPQSVVAIPFAEHVPDLTYRSDIAEVREYLGQAFSNFDWNKA